MIIICWLLVFYVVACAVGAVRGTETQEWKYHDYEQWPKVKGNPKTPATFVTQDLPSPFDK